MKYCREGQSNGLIVNPPDGEDFNQGHERNFLSISWGALLHSLANTCCFLAVQISNTAPWVQQQQQLHQASPQIRVSCTHTQNRRIPRVPSPTAGFRGLIRAVRDHLRTQTGLVHYPGSLTHPSLHLLLSASRHSPRQNYRAVCKEPVCHHPRLPITGRGSKRTIRASRIPRTDATFIGHGKRGRKKKRRRKRR